MKFTIIFKNAAKDASTHATKYLKEVDAMCSEKFF